MMKNMVLGLAMLATSSLAMAQQSIDNVRKISTKGRAEKEVTPDIIYLSISLCEYLQDGNVKKKVTIETIEKQLQEAALKAGIPKADFTIENLWSYQNPSNKKKDPGMLQSRQYRIKVTDLSKINILFDSVDPKGIHNTSIAEYDFSGKKELENSLKVAAVKDAMNNASVLAGAADQKVGKALLISENPMPFQFVNFQSRNMMMMKSAAADMAGEAELVDIDIKPIKVSAEVDVIFELL